MAEIKATYVCPKCGMGFSCYQSLVEALNSSMADVDKPRQRKPCSKCGCRDLRVVATTMIPNTNIECDSRGCDFNERGRCMADRIVVKDNDLGLPMCHGDEL